ncbi:hypothetical protein SteCoe_7608 [Stentor coeruleus]|uniref:VWFA domain-containing protein n=1 Tax=Stentor coeruleus TaxID=5963 RepID=A0A1R2CM77_9CILI|nr:hypothetical protein SteCoe_7608 [Stentor coeruleus]
MNSIPSNISVQQPIISKKHCKGNISPPETYIKASESDIAKRLKIVDPFGATCMRDAVDFCIKRVSKFTDSLKNQRDRYPYSFKIIVVTDGEDNASWYTAPDLSRQLESLTFNRDIDDINVVFITLDLDKHEQANLDLIGITHNSSTHAKLFKETTVRLEQVFERLVLASIQENSNFLMEKDGLMIDISRNAEVNLSAEKKFAVTFCLDISGSMEGQRWETLIKCVEKIQKKLACDEHNYLDCFLFNDTVIHYTHPHFDKKFVFGTYSCFKKDPLGLVCNIMCPIVGICFMQEFARKTALGISFNCAHCFYYALLGPIGMALNRRTVRKAYNIKGNCCSDFIHYCACMGCCLAAQEWKESRYRGQSLYLYYFT